MRTRGSFRTRRALRVAAAVFLSVAAVLGTGTAAGALVSHPQDDNTVSSAFTASETITRDHLITESSGLTQDDLVDTRNFSVTVSQTENLTERQGIDVSWTGAHPSGNIYADPNSQYAGEEEYPVVIMECRGYDSPTAPASEQMSPETCWTHTPAERYQSSLSNEWPAFRLDRYATADDRAASVGVPSTLPAACNNLVAGVQHWIPFDAADGTVYAGGPNGCAGSPPEQVTQEASLEPGNTTYAATNLQGQGSARFVIETSESNASLGCSNTVPCSLVIIPIMGISCDTVGANLPASQRPPSNSSIQAALFNNCSATGAFQPGSLNDGNTGQEDLTVAGDLWWSASNWRNRISVPLTFAPFPDSCNLANPQTPTYLYGSELMDDATQQWEPAFCLNPSLFKIQQVMTAEPEAKNLLSTGTIEAAIQGEPPQTPFLSPTVQSPIGLTGYAIAFDIADANGNAVQQLNLTPRLLAKLMTESYPAEAFIKEGDPGLSNNPENITQDPEFRALNPGIPQPEMYSDAAAVLYSLDSQSDAIWALTSYINADPAARAWLNGQPDPWGMVVNPAYKGIKLPVTSWPLLDTYEQGPPYSFEVNPCLASSPTPFLSLIASPVSSFASLTLNMQFDIANSQTICQNAGSLTEKLTAVGREAVGQQFIIGIVPYADALRYGLHVASLQTQVSPEAPLKFTDTTGRTFVAPDDDSLTAAAKLLEPDATDETWDMPYGDFQTDAAAAGAYPGTMLMSADVPTSGLPTTDAQHYSTFLTYAATTGQTPGTAEGDLAPGYVPLTAANGLGSEQQYAIAAAGAVAAQAGAVPSVLGTPNATTTSTTAKSTTQSGGSADTFRNTFGSSLLGQTSSSSGGTTPVSAANDGTSPSSPAKGSKIGSGPRVTVAATVGYRAGLAGDALPLAAGASLTALLCLGLGRTLPHLGRRRPG